MRRLAFSFSLSCEDTVRWHLSTSQGESPCQNPILLAPWPQTCSLQNCEKINVCCLSHLACGPQPDRYLIQNTYQIQHKDWADENYLVTGTLPLHTMPQQHWLILEHTQLFLAPSLGLPENTFSSLLTLDFSLPNCHLLKGLPSLTTLWECPALSIPPASFLALKGIYNP